MKKYLPLIFAFCAFAVFLLPSCASSPPTAPAWVASPDAVYPPSLYISAVGSGYDRAEAERNALAALVALFGQSVRSDMSAVSLYSEAVANGAVSVSENNTIRNAIRTSASMDTLVGAEIAEVWYDGAGAHYAVALMERRKTTALYTNMIADNQKIIAELIAMPDAEKYTLGGVARYRLAGTIADVNRVYATVLAVIGNGAADNLRTGSSYRLEAAEIAGSIPIAVRVTNDRNGRIGAALAQALQKAGFKSGDAASRYVLVATLSITEAPLQNAQYKFASYLVDTSLTDTRDGTLLLPFSISGREGQANLAGAESRALMAAEKQIAETYTAALTDWLLSPVPQK